MVLLGYIGAPQIAALLVLAQRGAEELYSARNTQALLAEGASEAGASFNPVAAATHLAWIASIFLSEFRPTRRSSGRSLRII
jgi:methyltransferase